MAFIVGSNSIKFYGKKSMLCSVKIRCVCEYCLITYVIMILLLCESFKL